MKPPRQPGLFDVEERAAQLTDMGDPLVGLKPRIDWEAFRPEPNRVHEKGRKSNVGTKPIDVVLMFKVLVFQQRHSLSDDGIEYQIRDRFSFIPTGHKCASWDCNWKTASPMPKPSVVSGSA
jgi:transposase, IS5 family